MGRSPVTEVESLGDRRDVSARADRGSSGRNAVAVDWLRQLANVVAAVGQIAAAWYVVRARTDQFTQPFAGGDPPVIPAEYAFSIWGLIYAGAVAYATWQALPRNAARPLLRRIGWFTAIAFAATGAWVLVAQQPERVWYTVALLLLLTGALGAALWQIVRERARIVEPFSRADRLLLVAPLSVFAGWGSVACFANIASALRVTGVTAPGRAETLLGLGMIVTASLGAALATRVLRGNRWYAGTVVWALVGIAVGSVTGARRPVNFTVAVVALAGAVLVATAGLARRRARMTD
jgi:hypothetical protein